jgi:hypothetical protein
LVYHRRNGPFEATALTSEEVRVMTPPPRKLSEIMIEMSERLLSVPGPNASPEAAHVALFFANAAWNESVGLDPDRNGYRDVWGVMEAENPELWDEFKTNDISAMIDGLVEYKKALYPDDRRRILVCGIPDGKVRVEWLPAAAPGVDSMWEFKLYGLVRTGERAQAVQFLRETRRMARRDAERKVKAVAAELGMR